MLNENIEMRENERGGAIMGVRRFRTINDAYAEIKAQDEKSAVTKYLIRHLCKTGRVKNMINGNRILVDMDDLLNRINSYDLN